MKPSRRLFLLIGTFSLAVLSTGPAPAQTGVWTWHNDNWRTGQNTGETALTPSNVNSTNFGQICSYPVDGQVFAQPLVLHNVTINSAPYTDVVYVATMYDSVYLFDGTTSTGTTCNLIASAVTGTSTSLIPSTETPVSGQCTQDAIHSATAFEVPTVYDGHVYVGAQSDNSTIVGKGTFYIFGEISNKTCTP